MINFSNIYRPITAQPFVHNETYVEIAPCDELKPYVCCFWGMPKPYSNNATQEIKYGLVTPDTCMDIIFDISLSENKIKTVFCGINDTSFRSQSTSIKVKVSCFAIRFYFWSAMIFSDESMKTVLNSFVDVEMYFKNFRRDLEYILIEKELIEDKIAVVESYLLKKLNINKQNNNVMNAINMILKSKGTANISKVVDYTVVSQRQLERLFLEYVGVTPKKLCGLVRYQYLWKDIVFSPNFNLQDSTYKYGFNDQAHLCNDFKKYHTMTPKAAKVFAYNSR